MKRFSILLAISSVLALSLVASAHDDDSSHGQRKHNRRGRQGDLWQLISGFKKHHGDKNEPKKDPIPIDPGRGDGRVPVNPQPLTPPVVRDHRRRAHQHVPSALTAARRQETFSPPRADRR